MVRLHGSLCVHRVRGPCRSRGCDCQRSGHSDCFQNWHGASDDSDQLMHLPSCVLVPDARLLGSQGRCLYSTRILCLRYHFQVWCGLGDLPEFVNDAYRYMDWLLTVPLLNGAHRGVQQGKAKNDQSERR